MAHEYRPKDYVLIVRGKYEGCEGLVSRKHPMHGYYYVILDGDFRTFTFSADDIVLMKFMPDNGDTFVASMAG